MSNRVKTDTLKEQTKSSLSTRLKTVFFKTRKRTGIIFIVLLLVGLFVWRVYGSNTQTPQYQTTPVTRGTLVISMSESGSVSVSNRVSVTTAASGIINTVYVKNGDTISAGQKIADIILDQAGQQRQAQAWSAYLSAQASLNSANAQLDTLQSNEFVANQKFMNDAVANGKPTADPIYIEEDAQWLAAEASYKNQQTVIQQSQAGLNSAWLSYEAASATITTPTDGIVSDLTIVPGVQITNTSSASTTGNGTTTASTQTVASIKKGGAPIITVNLSEVDATQIKEGQKATVTFDALPDKTFTGKVLGINTSGSVTSGVTTYPATIQLDFGNDQILPNMSATAQIITRVKDSVLLVPIAAVQTANGQSTVRVLKNGQVSTVQVTTSDSSDTETEIDSGLSEGDSVVTSSSVTTSGSQQTTSPFSGFNGRGFGGGARGGAGGGR